MKRHNLDLINKKYSEEELEENINSFNEDDWYWISQDQKLSKKFIEKYLDKVDWLNISKDQKLSENFIEKHSDKLEWNYISAYQKLSKGFIEKNLNKIRS